MDRATLQALLTDRLARTITIVSATKLTPPFEAYTVYDGEGRCYLVVVGQNGVQICEGNYARDTLTDVLWNVEPVFRSSAPR